MGLRDKAHRRNYKRIKDKWLLLCLWCAKSWRKGRILERPGLEGPSELMQGCQAAMAQDSLGNLQGQGTYKRAGWSAMLQHQIFSSLPRSSGDEKNQHLKRSQVY